MKDVFIADLAAYEDGKVFDSFFLVLSRQLRTTQSNKPYISLTLCDKTGQLEGRVWDPADHRVARDFDRGDVVKVRGCVSRFNDRLQLKVEQLRLATGSETDKSDLMPSTTYNVADLWSRLQGFVESFSEPHLKLLVSTVLGDPATAAAFREAPAAKQLHHAWLGGLLEHVVSLCTLADRVAPHYPVLHRDLLLTGVILHDIGKLRELSWDIGFEYTIEGTLLGHIQIGVSLAERTMDSLPGFPPRLKTLVLHLILSHHGKLEFGSPKLPMIPEALALNFIDDFDAKMQAMQSEFDKCAREGKSEEMTGRVWALDQRQLQNTRAWLAAEPVPSSAASTEPAKPSVSDLEQLQLALSTAAASPSGSKR